MGNAFTAVVNDYNAVLFNPAGLSRVKHLEAAAVGGRSFSGNGSPQTELGVLGALPMDFFGQFSDFGALGFLANRSGKSGENTITNAGISWGAELNRAIPAQWKAVSIPEALSLGLSLRIREIRRTSNSTDYGAGFDFGVHYQMPEESEPGVTRGWSFGAAVQEMNTQSVSAPVIYRLGAAWRHPRAMGTMDLVIRDGVANFFPGVEAPFFRKLLFLRAGTGDVPGDPRQIAVGLGVILPPLQIDLAYGFPTGESAKSNDRIAMNVVYRFGVPLLAQYFYQERVEKVTEIENRVHNLESQKRTLKTSIEEQKDLYDVMNVDVKRAQSKKAEAEKSLKEVENTIAQKKSELEKLSRDIQYLHGRKESAAQKPVEILPPHSGGPRKHKVVAGDSLRDLAEKYYGDPKKWEIIYNANEDKIIRGVPKEGAELIIP